MDTMDQIYLWKRLYWEGIALGLGPFEATRYANQYLPAQPHAAPRAVQSIRISTTYPPVPA
ncbi:MAG TPA: hypothetical protein VF859_09930 [Burkholderiales bacterium]